MRGTLTVLLVAGLGLQGCGVVRDSRLNPFNWFGPARPAAVAAADGTNPLIPRRGMMQRPAPVYAGTPIDQVSALSVEQVPGGAIVRATGIAARQGPYEARLTPLEAAPEGVLAFSFDVVLPERPTAVGPPRTREVTVAAHLTDRDLAGIREIRVAGARGAQVSTRR